LGASLGAVELVVALHRVFHSPRDRILFDVGHQAYAHKLLTGRRARMGTLRQAGGLGPFLDPAESPHDALLAGHACTAVSAGLGMQVGKRLAGRGGHVVAVVGDGALTGGLTFEGLNNAGGGADPLVVVLNDNQMSISPNVGAVSSLLRTRSARTFFEGLGFSYLGPVDGHDLGALVHALTEARRALRPMVVHALTQKGKGFPPAEADALTRGHAMGPYEWRDGKLVRSRGGQRTFSEAFASALEEAMARDARVVAVTPAMLEGSALTALKARFPDRVFDVGIAEQHAVTFCAGLAAEGLRPVCAIYSTFLQRAFDQVIHDVCLPRLPVVFAVDRAGLVGADGATHQGAYDVAALRVVPNLTLCAPVVGEDVQGLLATALESAGPTVLRFPRGTLPVAPPGVETRAGPVRGARWLRRASAPELVMVALGPLALTALEASEGHAWSVLDARFVTPLDAEALREAAACGRVLTVEEGAHGGLGSAVLERFAADGLSPRVRCLTLPDAFVPHGDARTQRAGLGLDAAGLRSAGEALVGTP
ncbi:MAG: 1-deoxy-D-xylulose-5-phosphate synthase, partial [Myxococcaceae bacterium]|nr:1-deoxy-D-xylulose-5-phosphate synthase [Myxococcaceae bacterium]